MGLLFLIPGMDETLRVNGTATLVRDEDLLQRLAVDGKLPVLAVVVHVEEAFLHCGRSSLRAQVWDPSRWMARTEMPSLSRIIADQTRPADRPQGGARPTDSGAGGAHRRVVPLSVLTPEGAFYNGGVQLRIFTEPQQGASYDDQLAVAQTSRAAAASTPSSAPTTTCDG